MIEEGWPLLCGQPFLFVTGDVDVFLQDHENADYL